MTLTIQTTDIITTGTAFTFAAAGDALWLREGVLIASTTGDGIDTSLANLDINIDGDFVARLVVIDVGGGETRIVIGETGSVTSYASNTSDFGAIYLNSGNNQLQNNGVVTAINAIGVASADDSNIITNTGLIQAGNIGVYLNFTGTGDRLINSGTISAGNAAEADVSFDDFDGYAVFIDDGGGTVVNTGTLLATASFGAGIGIGQRSESIASNVRNSGDIVSADWYGIDVEGLSGSGGVSIQNSGLISGDEGSYLGYTGVDNVNNRGLMVGDVDMAGGNDLYYGLWGAIEGDIFLGDGDDTASGGAEGERIEGGDGIDRIFGFGGDDNLFGDSGNDVLRGDAGADILNGGDGFDRASYADSSTGITIDLADTGLSTGFAQGDSYVSIEAYEATAFADVMFGDDVNNLLRGMDGDDQISGRGGNDNLQGFDGDDILSGGTGNDTLNGGDGDDIAAFTGDQADYTFTLLGNGNIRVEDTVGTDGIDILVAVEFVTFGGGAEIDVTGLI